MNIDSEDVAAAMLRGETLAAIAVLRCLKKIVHIAPERDRICEVLVTMLTGWEFPPFPEVKSE